MSLVVALVLVLLTASGLDPRDASGHDSRDVPRLDSGDVSVDATGVLPTAPGDGPAVRGGRSRDGEVASRVVERSGPADRAGVGGRPAPAGLVAEGTDGTAADRRSSYASVATGTVYSTYGAPPHMIPWMDSDALIFNRPLPARTESLPNSAAIARNIDEIIRGERLYDYGSGIEEGGNAPYMILVDSDREEFTEVVFRPQTCGADTWWAWSEREFGPYINGAYEEIGEYGIPLPSSFAMDPDDSDFHVMVYDWRRDVLIELWTAKASNLTGRPGIEACWGGIIKDFGQGSSGIFPFPLGVDAAGLSAAGLTITLEDVRRGSIDHAIGVSTELVLQNFDGQSHSYPANRNDGQCSANATEATGRMREVAAAVGGESNCLYEGQRLRFPADMDLESIPHPLARMIVEAGRDYGFVVHDVAGCFCIQAESGYAVTANGMSATDPWDEVYAGTPEWEILWQIDWTRLEVLPKDWGRPSGYRIPCATAPAGVALPNRGDPRCQAPGDPYGRG